MPLVPVNAIYSARPTVRLNGQPDERTGALINRLVVNEQEGGLSSLELRLSNSASLDTGGAEYAFDAASAGDLALGAEIIIGAGDTDGPVEIFRGLITGLEGVFSEAGPPELIVLAEDSLQKLRLARRTRVFENQSLADIARSIATDHGLTPVISGLDQNFGVQAQLNESDLSFLRRLLARIDADVQIVGTDLQISPRSDVRRGALTLAIGDGLKSARVLADLAHQITKTTVKGWDVSAGSLLQAEGGETALGPGGGDRGGGLLEEALGTRPHHSCHHLAATQSEADALATTIRNRRARRFLRVHGTATGNPALRVGTHVTLEGLGAWFSNTFYVSSARHLYDMTQGYRTEFEGQCAYLGTA